MNEEDKKSSLKTDRKIPSRELLKRAWPYIKEEWVSFAFALFLLLLQVAIGVIFPLIEEEVVDILGADDILFGKVVALAFGFGGLALVRNVFMYANSMILCRAGERIVYKLRMQVFHHVESMSQSQFSQMPVGSLVTRVASYTASVSDLFTNVLVSLFVNVLTVVGVFIVMLVISPMMCLVMLGFMVIIFAGSFFFNKYIRDVFTKERKYISDVNTFMNESLSGMKIIQLFRQEENKQSQFNEISQKLRKARFNVTLAFGIYRPGVTFLRYCAIAATFFLSPVFGLNAGATLAFYLYISEFFEPVQNIADQLNNIQRGFTALERIFNLLDVEPEVVDAPDAMEIDHVEGKIEFEHVYFAYEGENWVLQDVSFVIEPHTTAAFVGATGAGKSTILGLIVRNFIPQKGKIYVDGIDISKIKIQSLRKLCGQMLQDVFLFSGTVKDNITLYDDSISQAEVEDAATYVNAADFITRLPKGYDTVLSERGENISQGQRQLLSFARTVLAKPSILILDEATANIDTETESVIQHSLEAMKNIGTMIVVAHRLSTIQKSDKIIVLSHGKLLEAGTHQQLLKTRGAYYKLYRLQFEGDDTLQ